VLARFFNTTPASLIADHGDAMLFMEQQRSGTRYQGRNEWQREHQGKATVV
jgi:hypothetical protein